MYVYDTASLKTIITSDTYTAESKYINSLRTEINK